MANKVLFLCERSRTLVTSETQLAAPRFMVIPDMCLKLSFLCGSFPRTKERGIWALLRLCVYLQMPAKNLLELRTRTNMSRSNKLQLASSMLFVRLTTVTPRAIEPIVYNWSYIIVCFGCGIPGTIGGKRARRGSILVGRI